MLADGAVVVDTEHKTVQHLEGGIVERLHVREGSEVKEGQLLIELSETRARAEQLAWKPATTGGWQSSTG